MSEIYVKNFLRVWTSGLFHPVWSLSVHELALGNLLKFPGEAASGVSDSSLTISIIFLQDSYLKSRADTMQNIESTIVELGGIFQQLAHMVKEQEEMVQRYASFYFVQAFNGRRFASWLCPENWVHYDLS